MTGEEQRRLGLFVLLSSSGCLGLPRYTDDGDGGDEAGDDDTTTQTADEGPQGPDVTGPSPTSSNDDAASFVFMSDVGPITSPTTAATTDVTTDPPPSSDACQAYSVFVGECYGAKAGEYSYYYCMQYLDYIGESMPECVPLFEDYMVCISELSCEDLAEPVLCADEGEALSECQ